MQNRKRFFFVVCLFAANCLHASIVYESRERAERALVKQVLTERYKDKNWSQVVDWDISMSSRGIVLKCRKVEKPVKQQGSRQRANMGIGHVYQLVEIGHYTGYVWSLSVKKHGVTYRDADFVNQSAVKKLTLEKPFSEDIQYVIQAADAGAMMEECQELLEARRTGNYVFPERD